MLARSRLRLALGDASYLQAQRRVVQNAAPRHQQVLLLHVAHRTEPPVRTVWAGASKGQVARRRLVQSRDDVQQGALAAAGRADDGDELTLFGVEVNLAEYGKELPVVLEGLGQELRPYGRRSDARAADGLGCRSVKRVRRHRICP